MAEENEKDIQKETEETAEEPVTEEAETETEEAPQEETEDTEEEVPKEPETEETEAAKEPQKEKKSFFKKKDKKDPKDEKIAELTDKYTRLFAEFDNYRKRTEKEKASMYTMGTSSALEKLLPVVDSFERGLAAIPEADRESSVAVGMDKIYKQMVKILTDMGVEPMNCEGKEFDPNLHNAVMQVENSELESNTVAVELQKGYMYKGTVLRHAMVSVVQ